MRLYIVLLSMYLVTLLSCADTGKKESTPPAANNDSASNYAKDRDFLKRYTSIIELQKGSSKLLVAQKYQGRVMTSTCTGDSGYSFGWINYGLISSGQVKEHINPYGGEERLWLAPEGGQFSFFFKKNDPYDFEHWFTPREFDTEPFDLVNQTDSSVEFSKNMQLPNRSQIIFTIHIDRKITLLDTKKINENLGIPPADNINTVAYESKNTLTNKGTFAWTKKTGAPAVWLLGMLKPTPDAVIVLPIKGDTIFPRLHDNYFGAIPGDRLRLIEDHAFLKADGKFRGKVGIPPKHATNFIGSYDSKNKILTLIECDWSAGHKDFVNSLWEEQKDPFSGDAFNAYNDGPLKDGSQLGPFYELESLSPAGFLEPGNALSHVQITYHLQGDENDLDKISKDKLGVGVHEIENVFKK